MKLQLTLILVVGLLGFSAPCFSNKSESNQLPALGLASTLDVTLAQERLLGQAWLRQFRAQSQISTDALLIDYTQRTLQNLATWNTQLDRKILDVVIVNKRELNAFAVPGGVVGIFTGLFLYANYEDEFLSVVAHELAHISQRHFARRVQAAQDGQWKSLAGLLAGILVASQGHADAGIAAVLGSEALSAQNQLAWSRSFEQEADRLGMETLVQAGYSAEAMPEMFKIMQRLTSLNGRPPEFLLTHPLTESRISDAELRAGQLASQRPRTQGRDYQMLRVRLAFQASSKPEDALQMFTGANQLPEAQIYAKAKYAQAKGDLATYVQLMQDLYLATPSWLMAHYLYIEALMAQEQWDLATQAMQNLLNLAPSYYPAQQLAVDLNLSMNQWDAARVSLQKLSQQRPNDPYIWYQLAEAAGKSGRASLVHQARAEYFQLTGRFRSAFEQLNLAIKQAELEQQPWGVVSALRERRKDLEALRSQMESL